jgi:ribonuclease Z
MGSENFYLGEPLADDEIRVTLLGTGTPFPRRGQASASIFVEAGAEKFLFDCGPGAPQNFTSLEIPFTADDKVFTTHHHVDHIGGLDHFWIGGWTYGRTAPLKVWGPPGTDKIVEHLRGIYEWDIETRLDALPPGGHEIECSEFGQDGAIYDTYAQGGVRITAFKVLHCEPQNTFAMKVEYKDRTFVFSADTKKCDSMLHHAADCDLLVHEAFPPAELYAAKSNRPLEVAKKISEVYHTSPREAGEVFAETNPRIAVICHMYNNDDVIGPALDQIRENYQGPVEIGYDLMVINVADEIRVRPAVVSDKPWPIGKTA